ncbi:MAG: hypothetical protein HYW08_06920 [candidate division NC10 bacterium]|nr:hypothetical protein [Candidatus Rokubacteria bacterium]MBI2562110.1 hypothetical protein [candidate division NC10 bacterium]
MGHFYVPLTVFVLGALFPFYWMLVTAFRPDEELYRSWRAVEQRALLNAAADPGAREGLPDRLHFFDPASEQAL